MVGAAAIRLNRGQWQVAARDVFRYCTAEELLAANFAPPPDDKEAQDVERAAADVQGWPVAPGSAQNPAGAMFWGRGTRWCTAARSNNAFATYAGSESSGCY